MHIDINGYDDDDNSYDDDDDGDDDGYDDSYDGFYEGDVDATVCGQKLVDWKKPNLFCFNATSSY